MQSLDSVLAGHIIVGRQGVALELESVPVACSRCSRQDDHPRRLTTGLSLGRDLRISMLIDPLMIHNLMFGRCRSSNRVWFLPYSPTTSPCSSKLIPHTLPHQLLITPYQFSTPLKLPAAVPKKEAIFVVDSCH